MVQHFFYFNEGHSIEDFTNAGIVGLVNPPRNPEKKSERLGSFEGYWQFKLMTLEPYGLNNRDEFFNTRSGGNRINFLRYYCIFGFKVRTEPSSTNYLKSFSFKNTGSRKCYSKANSQLLYSTSSCVLGPLGLQFSLKCLLYWQ